ncbi:MAG: SDR family oxidoreductase [Actinobacteria bacterium]|nr:MAG: SDR family oxidoreductase [Actinomycetota bacterium]
MRVLVVGATGTLGHRLCLEWAERFECFGTGREPVAAPVADLLAGVTLIDGVSAERPESLGTAFQRARPEVVVNCIGAVKQAEAGQQAVPAIRINSLFPHELAALCGEQSARMVHISTDCVFSGNRGNYNEDDVPDATDIYGRSKLLGEVAGDGLLTLRTSLIGRELRGTLGLLEWLISNRGGSVRGFERAVFSGFTTRALAAELAFLIEEHPELDGIWHLAAEPIDKLSLLTKLNDALELGIEIVPDEDVVIDRSLDSSRLGHITGRRPPAWDDMVSELAADETPYEEIRRELAHR